MAVAEGAEVVDPGGGGLGAGLGAGEAGLGMAVPGDGVRTVRARGWRRGGNLNLGEIERGERIVTAWPASSGAVSYTFPWNLIVAVRAAADPDRLPQDAASSCAAPVNRGVPALHRSSGVAPVEEWTRTWYSVLGPGGEPAVQLVQAVRHPAAGSRLAVGGDLDEELAPHSLEKTFYLAASLGLTGSG